ncbi:hypothetical protein BJX64DRAFT_288017 [Aspergillus heterothallicus]
MSKVDFPARSHGLPGVYQVECDAENAKRGWKTQGSGSAPMVSSNNRVTGNHDIGFEETNFENILAVLNKKPFITSSLAERWHSILQPQSQPVPLLWNIQLNRNSKAAVMGLMSLGIFATLSACIRLKYTINLINQMDFLYAVSNVLIWGFAENAIRITVGNIATLRLVFHSFFERTIRHTSMAGRVGTTAGPGGYMNTVTEFTRGSHVNMGTGTGMGDESELSDGDSQKEIFAVKGGHGNADIMVSRQVDITYER